MPPIPFWARPRFVFLAIFAYLAAHFAFRFALGPSPSGDDAEQALFAQRYALSYSYRSPSLPTWILLTLGYVMPVGVVAISVMRYALLAITYLCGYLTARRLIADPRLAALAVYSFAAIHIFAESSHRNLTHSTSLAAMVALSWYVFVRLAASTRLSWYLALGVAFGLGMLAKWNFVIFAAALPIACLFNAGTRRLVLTWKTLAAVAIAAMTPIPALVAQLEIPPPAGQGLGSALGMENGAGLAPLWEGTLKLAEASLVYLMPLLPIAVLLLGLPFWRGFRARMAGNSEQTPPPGAAAVGPSIAIGIALLWIIVLVLEATEMKVRYMHPVLFIAPVWLFMVVEAGRPSARAVNLFALVMAALVVQVAVARILQPLGLVDCGLCQEWRPYPAVAAELRDAGYDGAGTIVASGEIGGNMRIRFPHARIVDPSYPLATWPPPSGRGQCLLLWTAAPGTAPTPAPYESYLADVLHGQPAALHTEGIVSAPMLPPAEGELRFGYWLYEGPNGDCR